MNVYRQLSDEEKHKFCNVETLGNLIMGRRDMATDFSARLKVLNFLNIDDVWLPLRT